jgi:hypothetical protein
VAISADSATHPGLKEVRQAKLVLPTLDDWRWDGAEGTMMLVTLHLEGSGEGCSDVFFNMGYAIWDGSSWELAYDGGCPRHWAAVQAPYPVPLGGGRYKIYFNPPTTTNIMEPTAARASLPRLAT